MIHQQQQCGACHIVNGGGVQLGPALNGVAHRRSKDSIGVQIRSPKTYNLSPRDLDGLIEYLAATPAQ